MTINRYPSQLIQRLLVESYVKGKGGLAPDPYNEPKEPYYIIVGNAIAGANIAGQRGSEFDLQNIVAWLDQLDPNIKDGDNLGPVYNLQGYAFDMVWSDDSKSIVLKPQ